MIDRRQLLDLVVRPALIEIGLLSDNALGLIMGTAAIESGFVHLAQLGGPALGLWQMEPATHNDIFANYLEYRPTLRKMVCGAGSPEALRLIYDLRYACKLARIQYLRAPEPIPAVDDLAGMDALYLKRYNAGGKSRPGEFSERYRALCADLFP